MSTRGNTIAEGFSQRIILTQYDKDILPLITNSDYQGEINGVGSKLNIMNFENVEEKTYANAAMTADALSEVNNELTITEKKAFYWKEKTYENWLSYIKNPHATIIEQVANERNRNKDLFVLGKWGDVGAGNWIGTSYATGTVAIDADGVVTGSGTAFTVGMEGKPFKADGHDVWYRVKTYTSAGQITIEDDLDDKTSDYTGDVITAGATYEIQANTAVTITTSNLLQYVGKLKMALDKAEAMGYSAVPDEGRFLIVPPEFEDMVVRASGVALHVPEVYTNLVQKGFITRLMGFDVYRSNRLDGDNTDGYNVIAGHPMWMTYAEKVLQARMEEDLPGDFGTAYKDLFVYGAKVLDARRHFAAMGFWKF